jgi:glycosyltransferase involved in cell wall biosynthesis
MRGRADIAGLRRALRFAGPKADVVVTQGVDAIVVGGLIARRAGAAHVVVEHGGHGLPRRLHRRLLTHAVARTVDSLVAVSASQLADLRALGYPPSRTSVISNGVERALASRGRGEVREELGVSADEFLAVFVGGLRPPKRPVDFIDAAVTAGIRGVVVGGGPLRAEVDAATALSGGDVVALGERADVADILGAADAVCLVSDVEALPLAALEGMSAGLPVVASDVGGVREAVVDRETGVLVPRGDVGALAGALRSLAGDRELAHRLGEAGRLRYEALFSADRMADEYLALLQRLAAAAHRP